MHATSLMHHACMNELSKGAMVKCEEQYLVWVASADCLQVYLQVLLDTPSYYLTSPLITAVAGDLKKKINVARINHCHSWSECVSPDWTHRRSPNGGLMLGQGLRRWPNIKPASGERIVSLGRTRSPGNTR